MCSLLSFFSSSFETENGQKKNRISNVFMESVTNRFLVLLGFWNDSKRPSTFPKPKKRRKEKQARYKTGLA